MPESKFFNGRVELNYLEGPKNGPPLLLVHGISGRWQFLQAYAERLKSDWHVFAIDLRGHGESSRVPGEYRLVDYAADVSRFIDACVGPVCACYGISLGAMITIVVAATRPELISTLVLAEPPWYWFFERRDPGGFESSKEMLQRSDFGDDQVEEFVELNPTYSLEAARNVFEGKSRVDPLVYDPAIDGSLLSGLEPDDALRSIGSPALILQADDRRNGLVSDSDARRMAQLIDDVEVVKFPGAAHILDTDAPGAALDVTRGFLARQHPAHGGGKPT